MASRSTESRRRAIESCPNKRRHSTMYDAGLYARKVRDRNKLKGDRRLCPYFCPNSDVIGPHYHVGHKGLGREKVIDILYRIRIGLLVSDGELDYAGLTRDEADAIRIRGEYLTRRECKVFGGQQ